MLFAGRRRILEESKNQSKSTQSKKKKMAKKARAAADAAGKERDEAQAAYEARFGDTDPYDFSDVPMELDKKRKALMAKLKEITDSSHYDECQCDLECHEDVIQQAFALAAERLFGNDTPVNIKFEKGRCSAYGEADEDDGAKERSMRLIFKHKDYTVKTGGSLDGGRGTSNVPWGVKLTKVPVLKEAEIAAARAHFKKAIEAFGLREAGEAAWHLVTVADGG